MRHISLLCLLLLINLPATTTRAETKQPVRNDTIQLHRRSFDNSVIQEFKNNPTYAYGRPREGLSVFQRILFWIISLVGRILNFLLGTVAGQFIFYGACAALILYVILKLLNIDVRDLFFKSSGKRVGNFKLTEESIHGLDFETLIADASRRGEFRDAVRLTFLYSLKKLSDAQLIEWMPGKTNDEYMMEVARHPSRQRLQDLRYYFDYAWYGHFEINEHTFENVQQTFREFDKTLS